MVVTKVKPTSPLLELIFILFGCGERGSWKDGKLACHLGTNICTAITSRFSTAKARLGVIT